MSERIFLLLERHQALDARLRQEQLQRWADPHEIVRLKKRKLVLRDRLARLVGLHGHARV